MYILIKHSFSDNRQRAAEIFLRQTYAINNKFFSTLKTIIKRVVKSAPRPSPSAGDKYPTIIWSWIRVRPIRSI